ncbi:MAG TPA: alcohol dehydrogenase family protein [Gammaproteobacteria bacterium]|nr:alcohol dehydrogenase family protein [Gammaproteobacteria bacterium]
MHMTLPNTMRAALLTGHGGPEMLEVRDDVPVPRPRQGEVLIEVGACGVNNTDIWVREGAYGNEDDPNAVSSWRAESTLTFPRIQGADFAGRIAAVGEGVSASRVGERVMVDFDLYGDDEDSLADIDYIGHGRDGGFAEYVAVPAENATAVDTPLNDAELATFCCAYVTGERMLNRARVRAGELVLVTGASGGVGSGLIQLCRARGAVPVAVVSKGKEETVRAIGAEHVVVRGEGSLKGAVKAQLGNRPIDVVADMVAGPLFKDVLAMVRPEGRYVTAGAIAGPVVALDLRIVYLRHLDLIGSSQGTRKEFSQVVDYILGGKIKPLLAGTYPLEDIRRAQADFKKKQFVGKLVIVPR